MSFTYLEHDELYEKALLESLRRAERSLWVATANVKETMIERVGAVPGRRGKRGYEPVARRLASLAARGVEVRLLHGGVPSRRFTTSLRASGALEDANFRMRRCVRVHFKTLIVDARSAYAGSANLTGAGLGAKSADRRNFEIGFWVEDDPSVARIRDLFSAIWRGAFCPDCGRSDVCGEPLEEPAP